MKKTLIFGHKNPDTDSICASIVLQDLENKIGDYDTVACRLGKINKETEFALNYFKVLPPELIENVTDADSVILVDHNSFSQSVDGIEKAKIEKVVDHHNITGFETKEPLHYIGVPVGSTCTIIYGLYDMNNIEISPSCAGLMLSAIISDTLLFKSPTCTKKDIEIAEKLAKIAKIDIESYGLELLKAGTDLSEFSADELINIDSKEFTFNFTKIQIAQVNTVSIEDVLKDKDNIEFAIKTFIEKNNLDLFIFAITDILNNNSQIIALGKRTDIVEKSYDVILRDNMAFLPGVVSRKKQIVPIVSANA